MAAQRRPPLTGVPSAHRPPAIADAGAPQGVEAEGSADGLVRGSDDVVRCWWAGFDDDLYARYHDEEWGVPIADDRVLFELLCLEGFQAGLSWITILRKRVAFRRAFAGFDPAKVAAFGADDVERLLGDASIVRHRGKVEAAIGNAHVAMGLRGGELGRLVWDSEPSPASRPEVVDAATVRSLVAPSEATSLSKALKQLGFRFVGPTTVYAFMQSAGVVNDHIVGCPRRQACEALRSAFTPPCGRR